MVAIPEETAAVQAAEEMATEETTTMPVAEEAEVCAADAVPEAPADALLEAPVDEVLEAPAGGVPEAPVDAVPEAPADAVPEAPVDAVLDAPAVAVPDAPAAVVADAQADEVQASTDEVLEVAVDAVPDSQADEVAEAAVDEVAPALGAEEGAVVPPVEDVCMPPSAEEATAEPAALDDYTKVLSPDPEDLTAPADADLGPEELPKSFTKEGRMILPNQKTHPKLFCSLRVTLRIERLLLSEQAELTLSQQDLQVFVQEEAMLGPLLVHWEENHEAELDGKHVEVVLALSEKPSESFGVGSRIEVERMNLVAVVSNMTETNHDTHTARLADVESLLQQGAESDAILLEIPLLWIIPDPDFKSKACSISLYPGSYWMSFLKSWGNIAAAEIFFRTVQHAGTEQRVNLLVKFADRASLTLCFTNLHKRFLAHPKKDNGYRDSWCQLVSYADFAAKAKSGLASKQKASSTAPRADGSGQVKKKIVKSPAPRPKQAAKPAPDLAPPTPMPSNILPRPVGAVPDPDGEGPMTPAEAMRGMTARQKATFEMVITRMERLEKENQELMQMLLQLNSLLQDSQRRNSRLAQVAAGYKGMAGGLALPPAASAQGTLAQAVGVGSAGKELPMQAKSEQQPVLSEGAMLLQQHRQQLQRAQEAAVASASAAPCPQAMSSSAAVPVSRVNPAPLSSVQQAAKTAVAAVPAQRPEKRKQPAEGGEQPSDPAAGQDADGEGGEQAPWKSQRRYQRRPRQGAE